MSGPLHEQVALVTGASRGIGRTVACRLAQAGAHVAVNFVHNVAGAEETVRRITDAGGHAEPLQFDVADADAVTDAVSGLAERRGRCDILINNAGMTVDGLLLRLKATDWDQVMAVNLRAPFRLMRAAASTAVATSASWRAAEKCARGMASVRLPRTSPAPLNSGAATARTAGFSSPMLM